MATMRRPFLFLTGLTMTVNALTVTLVRLGHG